MATYAFEMTAIGSVSGDINLTNADFSWSGETMTVVLSDTDDSNGIGDDAPLTETGAFPTVVSINGSTSHSWVGQSFIIGGVRDLDDPLDRGETPENYDIGILKVGGLWIDTAFVQLPDADVIVTAQTSYTITGSGSNDREVIPLDLNGDIVLPKTQEIFAEYGKLGLAATLAQAAYNLAYGELEGSALNNRDTRAEQAFDRLSDDLYMLTDADIDATIGTQTSFYFPRAGLDNGIYTNLNAAAVVARTDDALFLSFRGTNDNNGDNGFLPISPETPDGDHWVGKDDHWVLFAPLIEALSAYVGDANNGIKNVYVNGHSLGAAMVDAFMDNTPGVNFHANTFASPGYGGALFSDDDRITNLWIKGDPILGASKFADNEGDRNIIYHNLSDQLDDTNNLHNMSYYTAFVAFMEQEGIGEAELAEKGLRNFDYDRIYIDAVASGGETTIAVGVGGTTMTGSRKAEIMLGGAGNDTIKAGRNADYVRGGSESDTIKGEAGSDHLYGNNGRDTLIGGKNKDSLWGGKKADSFVFDDGHFSGATRKSADVIKDFTRSDGDKIDLSRVDANTKAGGDQDFTFLTGGAFTGAGQITFKKTTDGDTIVLGNTDKDDKAEFAILLDGDISLKASDFIL